MSVRVEGGVAMLRVRLELQLVAELQLALDSQLVQERELELPDGVRVYSPADALHTRALGDAIR